ncbi:LysR family transcriptional regulator [Streptomyces aureus]
MERQEIEIFLTLAEELHFGRTAERVGVSQSRVSQTIARVERRIGAKLFERSSRRVTMTAIGEQLRDGIGPAQRRIEEEIAKATAAGRGITGTLRIGFSGRSPAICCTPSPRCSRAVTRAWTCRSARCRYPTRTGRCAPGTSTFRSPNSRWRRPT